MTSIPNAPEILSSGQSQEDKTNQLTEGKSEGTKEEKEEVHYSPTNPTADSNAGRTGIFPRCLYINFQS